MTPRLARKRAGGVAAAPAAHTADTSIRSHGDGDGDGDGAGDAEADVTIFGLARRRMPNQEKILIMAGVK